MSVSVTTRPIEPATGVKWSAVHLPIVYQLLNDYYPVNSADTTRTISSEANDNGFMQLNLSGSLGTFEALDYVKISGADIPDGVYQIIAKGSSSQITINYPYASITNTGNVVLYKNNYHVLVRVYCGINASHIYSGGYELMATLKLVPSSENTIKFSINEIIKSKIYTVNTLTTEGGATLPFLPNYLYYWQQFYIEYAESYDVSDGDVVTTFTSSFTSDVSNLEGTATNSKLPFKNAHAGWMHGYVNNPRKFLTLFDELYLYPGNYMDVGFIIDELVVAPVSFVTKKYIRGVLIGTSYEALTVTNNYGVFRKQITQIESEDKQIIFLADPTALILEPSAWTDGADPFDTKNDTTFSMIGGNTASAYQAVQFLSGETPDPINLVLSWDKVNPVSGTTADFYIKFYDTLGGSVVGSAHAGTFFTEFSNQMTNFSFSPLTGVATIMEISVSILGGILDEASIQMEPSTVGQLYSYTIISEQKTVNVNTACSNQELNIGWLNYLGGFDWHVFTTRKKYSIDSPVTQTQKKNIFNGWPDSYSGGTADTINRVTRRESKNIIEVTSQFVTVAQEDAIKYITTSPLVQIVNSASDRRTVIVKNTTLALRRDQDKSRKLSFILEYTDDIPSQSL